MAGVTDAGFVTKRFPEITEDLRAQAVPQFQDLVSPGDFVDTSDSTVLGRLIGLTTPALTELWEALQEVYAAFDPNTATGVALVNLVALGGLTPQLAAPTTFSAIVWGDTYTEIPVASVVKGSTSSLQFVSGAGLELAPTDFIGAGIIVTDTTVDNEYSLSLTAYAGLVDVTATAEVGDTEGDILLKLKTELDAYPTYTSEITDDILYIKITDHYSLFNISLGGDVNIAKVAKRLTFSAMELGPNEVPLNTVTSISTPVLGWDSVDNPVPAIVGVNAESDTELRERFRLSKYLRASNTSDALYSALLELDGIQEVRLYVNDTDIVDSIGLDPHSFLALILGGSDVEIAQVIWKHTPLGIASQGAQEVSVLTNQGNSQIVKFDRPVYVPIYAELELSTYEGFPVGGEDLIAQKLSDYVATTQAIGGRVVYSRLFDPANEVPGHEIVTLKIGTSPGALSETTLNMAYNEIPVLSVGNVEFI